MYRLSDLSKREYLVTYRYYNSEGNQLATACPFGNDLNSAESFASALRNTKGISHVYVIEET